tara:strand:- start:357 stop:740 length:384 start_codon:yes stop_codon:yes gene_type:complete
MNGFYTTKTELEKIAKNLEYGRSQQYINNMFLDREDVKKTLRQGDILLQRVRAAGGALKVPAEELSKLTGKPPGLIGDIILTETKISDAVEDMYPEIRQEIQERFKQSDRQTPIYTPDIQAMTEALK